MPSIPLGRLRKALAMTSTRATTHAPIIHPPVKSLPMKAPAAANPHVTPTRNITRAKSARWVTCSRSAAAAWSAADAWSNHVPGLRLSSAMRALPYPSASGAMVSPAPFSCSHTSSARSWSPRHTVACPFEWMALANDMPFA